MIIRIQGLLRKNMEDLYRRSGRWLGLADIGIADKVAQVPSINAL